MREFNCLSEEHYHHPFLFLEASAGSGKTFAIENLFVRSLLGFDRPPVSIDKIAILTFTNAATKELKSRIYEGLLNALHHLMAKIDSKYEYLNVLIQKGETERGIALLRRAIQEMQEVNIFTIHGFCLKLLAMFPLESKAFIDSEEGARERLETILLDELRALSEEVIHPIQMTILLKFYQKNIGQILVKIEGLIHSHLKIKGGIPFKELSFQFSRAISLLKNYDFEKVYKDLLEYGRVYNKILNKDKELIPSFGKQLKLLIDGAPLEEFLPCDELFFEMIKEENKKKRETKELALTYPDLVDYLQKEVLGLINAAKEPEAILLSIAQISREKILKATHLRPYIFPDALLSYTLLCLEKGEFLKKIRAQFTVAIIDEFQDTDSHQWAIFKKLFVDHHPNLSLFATVGDPKQSIYSFRGADLATYLEAKKTLGEEAYRVLTKNYRSSGPLVDLFNVLFEGESSLFSFDHSLSYIPSKATTKEEKLEPSLVVSVYRQEESRSKIVPSLLLEEERIFPFIAKEIATLKAKGVSLSEMVILVKDRHQARRVFSHLYKIGIAANLAKSSSIVETEGFFLMTLFIRALSHANDDKALKNFLCHPTIGLGLEEKWHLHFLSLKELYTKGGIASVLDTLYRIENGYFLSCFLHGKDLSLYSDMQKLTELLINFEFKEGKSLLKLSRYLERLKGENSEHSPLVKRELIAEEEAISIMTVHASKGLEFRAVFALGVSSRFMEIDELIKVKDEGDFYQVMTKREGARFLKEVQMRQAGEKMRLFYVALTRAKEKAYLFLILKEGEKESSWQRASPLELFFAKKFAKDRSEEAFIESFNEQNREKIENYLKKLQETFSLETIFVGEKFPVEYSVYPKHSVIPPLREVTINAKERSCLSFSLLHETEEKEGAAPLNLISKAALNITPSLPMGSKVGTLLHEMIEIVMSKGHSIEETVSRLSPYTPLEGYEEEVKALLKALFKMEIIEGLPLSEITRDRMLHETSFCYANVDHEMRGFIDCIFEHRDKIYLIDWKSNFLGEKGENYEKEALIKEMAKQGYDLQASIYKEALKRYLGLCDDALFEERFGGAIYVFLRGALFNKGILHFMPKEVVDYVRD